MGCGSSGEEMTLAQQFAAAGLPEPIFQNYENEFEKNIYYAINLCRANPKSFVSVVNQVKDSHPVCKGKATKDLIEHLKNCPPRGLVGLDEQAIEAVRQNNIATIAEEEAVPRQGGNIHVYKTMCPGDAVCEEFTMCQFDNEDAKQFVAVEMIMEWNKQSDDGKIVKRTPVLDEMTGRVGISNKPHKKTTNLIQILYVQNRLNTMY